MPETAEQMRQLLILNYTKIQKTRMEGVPILNEALSVAAIGFEEQGAYRLGVLLTPWFMNLMMLPLENDTLDMERQKFGSTQSHRLPGGDFAFIVGHEEAIGFTLSCSLFSPVFEFLDQQTAVQTAKAVLEEVLRPVEADDQEDHDADMREIWAGCLPEKPELEEEDKSPEALRESCPQTPKEFSRRDVLRGLRKTEKQDKHL